MTTTAKQIAATGKVIENSGGPDGIVKFAPANTTYHLYLSAPGYSGPVNTPMNGVIRVTARKAYTVPSGGNFVSPIYGPPRTIQGRVLAVDGNSIVVHAGTTFHVKLPDEASAVELANGSISVGSLVNVVALPGATFEEMR